MRSALIGFIAVSAVSLNGCATKSYGRLAPVSASEMQALDCPAIDAEIGKARAFQANVAEQAKFNGASAVALAIDGGAGNVEERRAADNSAAARLHDLEVLKVAKHCVLAAQGGLTPSRTPTPVQPAPTAPAPPVLDSKSHVQCVTCR